MIELRVLSRPRAIAALILLELVVGWLWLGATRELQARRLDLKARRGELARLRDEMATRLNAPPAPKAVSVASSVRDDDASTTPLEKAMPPKAMTQKKIVRDAALAVSQTSATTRSESAPVVERLTVPLAGSARPRPRIVGWVRSRGTVRLRVRVGDRFEWLEEGSRIGELELLHVDVEHAIFAQGDRDWNLSLAGIDGVRG